MNKCISALQAHEIRHKSQRDNAFPKNFEQFPLFLQTKVNLKHFKTSKCPIMNTALKYRSRCYCMSNISHHNKFVHLCSSGPCIPKYGLNTSFTHARGVMRVFDIFAHIWNFQYFGSRVEREKFDFLRS